MSVRESEFSRLGFEARACGLLGSLIFGRRFTRESRGALAEGVGSLRKGSFSRTVLMATRTACWSASERVALMRLSSMVSPPCAALRRFEATERL